MERVWENTSDLSFVGSFRVSFIGGFTVVGVIR